jgi:CHAT domain-containing protein
MVQRTNQRLCRFFIYPTLTALLSAKRLPTQIGVVSRLLAVSQPATPCQHLLPGTVREVNAIETIHQSTGRLSITRLDGQEATIAAVLQGMKECNWIHLACHGVQDATSATDSAFMLIDGRLTLKEIMKQSFSHTELAALSACQTAKGDKELPEEAIHLAAGMLLAGYWSIVATMWSIEDDDGPVIAEMFYKYLIDEARGDSGRAACALHDAVAHFRHVRGENKFASWVLFIHFGICSPT